MTSPDGPGHLTTDELFRQHAGFVARFLSRLGVPSDQLEDALQEVFLVVHRNGGYKPGLAKPASYLGSIALRAAAKHRRRDGLARQRHADAAFDHMPGEHEDPARALQTRQDLERLQRALQRLPEELCTTLLLVEMEGESCVSVAAGLGCPVGTIYWRLHQARKELRAALRALEAPRRTPASEPLEERAQPARSWMILLGLDGFDRSEACRLLQLARVQPATVAVEELLARHHQLIRTGAELPAWASGVTVPPASWLGVLGAGPIALGVVASGAIIAASALAFRDSPEPPVPARDHVVLNAVVAEVPAQPVAPITAEPAEPAEPPGIAAANAPTRAAVAKRSRAPSTGESSEAAAQFAADPALDVLTAPPTAVRGAEPEPVAHHQPEPHGEREPLAEPEPRAAAIERPREPDATDEQIGRALTDEELAEMRAIARAERLLTDEPKRALALTRAMAAGFPKSRFSEERAYLEVMALEQLGRTGEMRDKGAAFLSTYPAGLYSERVRKALASASRGE